MGTARPLSGCGGAARRLRKAGFERVYVLDGGIGAWQQDGLPMARGR